MSARNVQASYPAGIAAVRAFFEQFYGTDITVSEDADAECVLFAVGQRKNVVAIGADFLAEFDAVRIRENLAAWNIAHLSRTLERGCRLSVTSEGPEEQRDSEF